MISRVIFVIDAVTFEIVTAFLIYLFFDTNFLKGVSAPIMMPINNVLKINNKRGIAKSQNKKVT